MSASGTASVTLSLIDRLTGPLTRIKAKLATLGKNLGFDRIGAQLKNVGNAFKGFGEGLARSAMRFAATATALSAAVAGIAAAAFRIASDTAELGAGLKESSTKLGIGVEPLQEWRYAAEMSAISGEELDRAIAKLGVNASASVKGNKAMAKSFKALGVNVRDANGKLKPTESILQDTLYALADMRDPLRRNELAMKLFGKSGVELAKMMGDGADGLKALRQEARRTGSIISDETASLGDAFGDNLDKLKKYISGLKNTLGAALLPTINDLVVKITAWVDANRDLLKQKINEWAEKFAAVVRDLLDPTSRLRKSIDGIGAGIAQFGRNVAAAYQVAKPFVDFVGGPMNAALLALGAWIMGPTIAAITALTASFVKLGAVMLTTPFGWIVLGVAAVAASVYVLIQRWDEFVAYWQNLWGRIKSAFDSSWTEGIATTLAEFNPLTHIARGMNAVIEHFTGINLVDEGTRIIKSLADGIAKGWADLKLDIEEQWITLTGNTEQLIKTLKKLGSDIVDAIWDGLKAKWAEVTEWIADAMANLVPDWAPQWMKDSLGLNRGGGEPEKVSKDGPHPRVTRLGFSANDNKVPGAGDDNGGFLKDLIKRVGQRAFGPEITMPKVVADVVKVEPARVETPDVSLPKIATPSVASVISLQDAIRARAAGIGGNTTDSAPGKMKDDLDIGRSPQSISASSLTVGSVNMPEPIIAHEPQSVSAPFTVNLTVNAQGDANAIAGAVKSALAAQAAQQAAAVKSSFSD